MSDLQKDAARSSVTGRVFQAIQPIFASLPERFTSQDVLRAAGLQKGRQIYAVISVLERSFKCTRNANGIWRKPGGGRC